MEFGIPYGIGGASGLVLLSRIAGVLLMNEDFSNHFIFIFHD